LLITQSQGQSSRTEKNMSMFDRDQDRLLCDFAGKAAGQVELLASSCKHRLAEVSLDAARHARMDVRDAIELLRAIERSLTQRIGD
jgi:hypothetical protein